MPLTAEQIAGLPEGIREEVAKVQGVAAQTEAYMKHIFSNPETRKEFTRINEKMPQGVRLDIPADPMDSYVAPLKGEIDHLKGKIKESDEEKLRNSISAKMAEMGIPASEVTKIGEFQSEHSIGDPIKAIELYAKTMDREPETVSYRPNAHKFDAAPDEGAAMENALSEITNYRRSLRR